MLGPNSDCRHLTDMSIKKLKENLKTFETNGDVPPVPLKELADDLRLIGDELSAAYELDGFADELNELADRIEDRIELTARKQKLDVAMSRTNANGTPFERNADQLIKATRRDRRFAQDMRLILEAGGRTYRGMRIYGTRQEPYVFRFTRQEVLAEFRGDHWNQLGRRRQADAPFSPRRDDAFSR